MAQDNSLPIILRVAERRDDKGKTLNYMVYETGRQMQVKNAKGENVVKNAIMGGNDSIYIGHELAGTHTEWVLMPRAMFDQIKGRAAGDIDDSARIATPKGSGSKPPAKKGKR